MSVRNLRVETIGTRKPIVDGVSLEIGCGEVLGLVGESGSGKTTLGLALLGHARRGLAITNGEVLVDGQSVLGLPSDRLQAIRGSKIAYVPQDPGTALNPLLRVGSQLREPLRGHPDADTRVDQALESVKLPSVPEFLRSFPHQLSGGQLQRVAIAMALVSRPTVLVMDEPTTGLDVTTQAHILRTIESVCAEFGGGVLYVTHDLAVVASLCERTAVMYAGGLVEVGSTPTIIEAPRHPYVQGLIRAVPDVSVAAIPVGIPGHSGVRADIRDGCAFAPRCLIAAPRCTAERPAPTDVGDNHRVWCLRIDEGAVDATRQRVATPSAQPSIGTSLLAVDSLRASYGKRPILRGVSLTIRQGQSLALVGESGSGKTTLARCVAGLRHEFQGQVVFQGAALRPRSRDRAAHVRAAIQYVFQNPYASLNPRRSIEQLIAQPLLLSTTRRTQREIDAEVGEVMEAVALERSLRSRAPRELSGGQRQRVAIARALVVRPQLLICDEVTSSLDVSVQAHVIELLDRLRRERQLSLLFVTHNLALVPAIADEVAVLDDGMVVEHGTVRDVLDRPSSPRTRALLDDMPALHPRAPRPPGGSGARATTSTTGRETIDDGR